MSVNSLRKPLGDRLENFHCFRTLLLTLQAPPVGIKLHRSSNFERMIPSGFCLIRPVQGFEDIRFGAEVIESFFVLNGGISPAQRLIEIDLSGQTELRAFIQSLPRKLPPAFQLRSDVLQRLVRVLDRDRK